MLLPQIQDQQERIPLAFRNHLEDRQKTPHLRFHRNDGPFYKVLDSLHQGRNLHLLHREEFEDLS